VFILISLLILKISFSYPSYQTKSYVQRIDHFNFEVKGTYNQRYLYNDQSWGLNPTYSSKNCKGPIFFYTGNESPVTDYWAASGFFVEILAPKYGALLIFAEHRYFGESMPFGNDSFSQKNIGYCSASQALADYAQLITFLKRTLSGASDCPVFSFGGSYGGMLTTWFRLKYPNIVMGGLAASAPFSFYGSGISPYAFSEAATDTYRSANKDCPSLIQQGFNSLQDLSKTQSGRDIIASKFKLCYSLNNQSIAQAFIGWVDSGLESQTMLDYPYPTNYGISIGGWPVNETCKIVVSAPDVITGLAKGIGVWYNYTGDKTCYDINRDVPDWGVCCGWPYLYCTEVYIPAGVSGIFPHSPFNLTRDIQMCKDSFGVDLDPNWSQTLWGGFDSLNKSSNIIFSNGLLDPWHSGGVLKNLLDLLIAIVIPASAHHLDLWSPNPKDPIYVTDARKKEDIIVGQWLLDYFKKL